MDDTKTRYSVLKYLYRPQQVIELAQIKDPRNKEDYHKVENTADGLALFCELTHDGVTGSLKEMHVYRGFMLQERVNFSYTVPSFCPAHPAITSAESPFRIKIVCGPRNIGVWYDSPVVDGDAHLHDVARGLDYKKLLGNFQLNMQDQETTQKIVNTLEHFQQRHPSANFKLSKIASKTNTNTNTDPNVAGGEDKRQKMTGSPAIETQIVESQQSSQSNLLQGNIMIPGRYGQPSPTARLATSSPTQLSDSGFASEAFKVPTLPRVNALRGTHMSTPTSSPPLPASHIEQLSQQASSPSNLHQITTPNRTSSPVPGATFSPSQTGISGSSFHTYPLHMHDSTMPSTSTYKPNIAYLESQANKFPFQATQYEYDQPSFNMDRDRDAFLFDSQSQRQSFAQTQQIGIQDYQFPPKNTDTVESQMQVDDEATEYTIPPTLSGPMSSSQQTSVPYQTEFKQKEADTTPIQSQAIPDSISAMEAAPQARKKGFNQSQTQLSSSIAPMPTVAQSHNALNQNRTDDGLLSNGQSVGATSKGVDRQDDQISTNPMAASPVTEATVQAQNTSVQMEDIIRDFTSLTPHEAREVILSVLSDPNFASMVNMVYRMPEFRMAG